MDNFKNIRWRQRFQNLNKAFEQLQRGLAIKTPSDIEQQGIIQSFEFTFDLSWKTMKDYLEAQGVACQFPRDVIKRCSPGNTLKKKKCQLSYQFGYTYRIDWRIDPCENPRTGASHAQTRNVPIIG